MPGTRGRGQPDREIHALFASLNQERRRERHDVGGLYEGRLRSHEQAFEGLKRKWEGFTGAPVPKKLRTSEPSTASAAGKENAVSNQTPVGEEIDEKPAASTVVKQPSKAAAAAPPPPLPPHPDDKIDVDKMIVNDLRKELKKRKLGTGGRKAELQARLREYCAESRERREADWAAKHPPVEEVVEEEAPQKMPAKQVRIGAKPAVEKMDVVMEDAEEETKDIEGSLAPAKKAPGKGRAGSNLKDPPMEEEVTEQLESSMLDLIQDKEPPKKKVAVAKPSSARKAPKSALKPSKYAAAGARGTPQLEAARPAPKPAPASTTKEVPTKVSESSADSATAAKSAKLQKSAQKTKISSTLAQTTPGGAAFKTGGKAAGGNSAKLLEKKRAHAAATEARKARMAEMRQKAGKPVAGSASKPPPSSSSKYAASSTLKKMASNSALGEGKPNSILSKMREKAAAGKNAEHGAAAAAASAKKPTVASAKPVVRHGSMASPSIMANAKLLSQAKPQTGLKASALKNKNDPANRPSPIAEAAKPPAAKQKPLSPMQTYEMSDREANSDSDSDSDEEENQRPRKTIPEWAQKANLYRALERQFADGPDRLDPDAIFGEVLTCNLEEIFDKKKSRYQRRTSSGNWTKDHVTLAEKLTYKRTMGYDK